MFFGTGSAVIAVTSGGTVVVATGSTFAAFFSDELKLYCIKIGCSLKLNFKNFSTVSTGGCTFYWYAN